MPVRKITFFRWTTDEGPLRFVPSAAAAALEKLREDAIILDDGDHITAVEVRRVGNERNPTELMLLSLRGPESRPLEYGPRLPLAGIPMRDGRYPADLTHVVIWPDGYAAQDSHAHSPRMARLSEYVRNQCECWVYFEPMYQPDVADRLKDIKGRVRRIEIAMIQPHRADTTAGVLGNLIPAAYGPEAPSVRVSLGMGRYGSRSSYIDSRIEDEAASIALNSEDLVDSLVFHGRSRATGQMTTVDMTNEKLQIPVDMPLMDTRLLSLVNPDEAFRMIRRARVDLDGEHILERAPHSAQFGG